MMREILALLGSIGPHDVNETEPNLLLEMVEHLEPLPFPSASDRIREPTQEQYAELRRKIRTKLSSRRYARRRKDESKAQSTQLRELHAERSRLQTLDAMLSDASVTPEERQHNTDMLHEELSTLLRETKSTAAQTFDLYEQVERMMHPCPNRGLAERALRPDHLSAVHPVRGDWSEADQLHRAIANIRTVVDVLSDTQRDGSSDFILSVYRGWRVVECRRRGSRFCVQASKRVVGVSRQTLSEHVWENADDQYKRVVLCAYYTRFSVVTLKKQQLDVASSAFYSEELHEFPSPFLCRTFTSIHGVYNDGDDWYYVKHSLDGKVPRLKGHKGAEVVGVILRDAPKGGVNVELVLLYDTQSVCHAEQIVCEEPPVCQRVLAHWEQNHGLLDSVLSPASE